MSEHVVYGLTDPRTGELRYVGFSKTPRNRLHGHKYDAKRGCSHRARWVMALRRLDLAPEMFVIEKHDTRSDAAAAEVDLIAYFRSLGCDLTNATDGGEGAVGYRWSLEERARMSERVRGERHPNYGKKHSEATRRRIGEALRGKTQPAEVNAKRAATMRSKHPRGAEYRRKLSDSQPKKTYTLRSPAGEIVTFTGLAKFCRENGLSAGALCSVASYDSHRGWTRP